MLHWAGRSAETQPAFPSPPFCYHSDLGNSSRWFGCQSRGKLIREEKKEREREGKERGRRKWIRMGMGKGVTTGWIHLCSPQTCLLNNNPILTWIKVKRVISFVFSICFYLLSTALCIFFHVSRFFPSRDAQPRHFHPLLPSALLPSLNLFSLVLLCCSGDQVIRVAYSVPEERETAIYVRTLWHLW